METEEEYTRRVKHFVRSGMIMAGAYPNGDLMSIERPWTEFYAITPVRTITGKWVYMEKIFKRRVWRSTGFAQEPYTEYARLFEMITNDEQPI